VEDVSYESQKNKQTKNNNKKISDGVEDEEGIEQIGRKRDRNGTFFLFFFVPL